MARVRLDAELVAQGYCQTADEAARCVMAGMVSSCGERLSTPGMQVKPGVELHVKGARPYVSRGGVKLAGALDAFSFDVSGMSCVDVGCSSGGFTDCLLKRGAARVLAVDVGRAQFDWALRGDSRVTLLERTNIVDVPAFGYRGACDLAVCDVSFTGIERVLPAVVELLREGGAFLALVKPQFEAAPDEVGEGGIVRDPAVRRRVLVRVLSGLVCAGFSVEGVCVSPIAGAKGNREFFALAHAACAAEKGAGDRGLAAGAGEPDGIAAGSPEGFGDAASGRPAGAADAVADAATAARIEAMIDGMGVL